MPFRNGQEIDSSGEHHAQHNVRKEPKIKIGKLLCFRNN